MIDLQWLSDRLCDVARWQVAHPDAQDDPAAPEVPWAGQRAWGLFLALHGTRGGGMGPAPITYAEIEAYVRRTGDPVRPFEVDMIRAIDAAWLKCVTDKDRPESPARPVSNGRPMSPALFDALFQE